LKKKTEDREPKTEDGKPNLNLYRLTICHLTPANLGCFIQKKVFDFAQTDRHPERIPIAIVRRLPVYSSYQRFQ